MKRLITIFVFSLAWILTARTDLSANQSVTTLTRPVYGSEKPESFVTKQNQLKQDHTLRKHRRSKKERQEHYKKVRKMYPGSKSGANDTIVANYDYYISPEASFTIGGSELPELPAGFFGEGSDPFSGTISFKGEYSQEWIVPDYDVEIDRMGDVYFTEPYPSTARTDIEISDMGFVSTVPITVTYNDGQYSEEWNVEMYYYSGGSKGNDSIVIVKTDETGGYFYYAPLNIQPYFYFWNDDNDIDWNTSDSIPPISFISQNNPAWSHSPIGQDFNPSENDTLNMVSESGESFFKLLPLNDRDDQFNASVDGNGNVTGSGTGFNGGNWYYYPGKDLWMTWFYDHPFNLDRVKDYYADFSISSVDSPAEAHVYLGWSTPDWTNSGGVPGEPPLPQYIPNPQDEELYISLSDPLFSGEIDGTQYPYIDYQITGYNPEWVCIAIKGAGFNINNGYAYHICFDPDWDNDSFDFGDAPDPDYPTLLADDGARHRIFTPSWGNIVALGADVDSEPDGQPDPNGLGDDNSNLDDEDGLINISELKQGQEASLTVAVTETGGYFNAWIDYNADGDWDDANEHIISNEYIPEGIQNTFYFTVPAYASSGQTMLRMRYSSLAGPGNKGAALDGEVEDYAVNIESLEIKWEQQPDTALYGYESHDYNTSQGDYRVLYVADDWECQGGWVNKIEWWGYYSQNNGVENRGAGIDHFNIQILSRYYPECTPPDWPIISFDVPFDSVYEQSTGWTNVFNSNVYHYECNLEEPFIQHQGEKYWLVITAISNDPNDATTWSWQESDNLEEPVLCGGHYKNWPESGWSEIIRGEWPVLYPDYAFIIHSIPPLPADLGDAPAGSGYYYNVLLANDGAIHIIDPSVYLGNTVDAEPDGLPDTNALGDDNNNTDDEDGVLFLTPLIAGQIATIQVTASVQGYLNVWGDFGHWKTWEDQQIFHDTLINPGLNTLSFPVPFDAVAGTTFFRFRFSTVSGIDAYGQAPDGEVEDYAAEVTVEQNKWSQPPTDYLTGTAAHDYYVDGIYTYKKPADDWICMGGNVDSIRWWGTYNIDAASGQEKRGAGIDHFHLSINLNSVDNEPSSTEEWSADIPFSQIEEKNTGFVNTDGSVIYEYTYVLPVPFEQVPGNHYWFTLVAFCNDPTDPAEWNWQESKRGNQLTLNPAMFFYLDDPSWYVIYDNGSEVDLAFEIFSDSYPEYDFGDAPSPYATLTEDDGAIHIIDTTLYLGDKIDSEADGQPETYALGDDQNGLDDEDGVTFSQLYPGYNSTFTVKASAPGYLNVWIDFYQDGVWQEEDHIINDKLLSAGINYIEALVPEDAYPGYTFARFRFSSEQGLAPTGIATDGEVEDYRVYIEDQLPYKWEQPPESEFFGMQVNANPNYLLADDFICNKTGDLTDINIYGDWFNGILPDNGEGDAQFTLAIHDAAPYGDGTMPGNVLWSHTYQPGDFSFEYVIFENSFDWQNPDGTGYLSGQNWSCIRYDFQVPQGDFKQEGTPYLPKTYWLTLQVVPNSSNPDCKFGWNNSETSFKIGTTNGYNAMWATGTEPYSGTWDSVFYAPQHTYAGEPMGFAFDIKGLEDPYILLYLTALPEFAIDLEKDNSPDIGDVTIPLHQPFNTNPNARWYYNGDEQVEDIPDPGFTLDWVLVELREATSPELATDATVIGRVPAFVDQDGDIYGTDGNSYIKFYVNPVQLPYVAVWQRNHLGVLSSGPIEPDGPANQYRYFFNDPAKAYGGTDALKHLYWGAWVMYGGDVNGDGVVDEQNDLQEWELQAGEHGYLESDVDLNSEVDNMDKDDVIIENLGKVCLIPQ